MNPLFVTIKNNDISSIVRVMEELKENQICILMIVPEKRYNEVKKGIDVFLGQGEGKVEKEIPISLSPRKRK